MVTQGIAYDLLRACDEVGRGLRPCPELLGDVDIEPVVPCERRAHSSRSPAPIAKVVDRLWASAGGEESSDSTEAGVAKERPRSAEAFDSQHAGPIFAGRSERGSSQTSVVGKHTNFLDLDTYGGGL